MKGVASCAAGRAIERATQNARRGSEWWCCTGEIDERSVPEAFQGGDGRGDEKAEDVGARRRAGVARAAGDGALAAAAGKMPRRLRAEPGAARDGPWLVAPEAAALLEAVLPVCTTGKPADHVDGGVSGAERRRAAIAFVPLDSFDAGAVQKLWMRGQASKELASVSLKSWQTLADRLGRNARILTLARALPAGKTETSSAGVAVRAAS